MSFCPHCGFNLNADEPVEIDGWRVTTVGVERDGKAYRLSAARAIIVHSLATARGDVVSHLALCERADIDCDSLTVIVYRIRREMPELPIETVHGRGYRWATARSEAA